MRWRRRSPATGSGDPVHPHPSRPQPGGAPLAAATGAPIIGCAPLALEDDGPRADAAFDPDYGRTGCSRTARRWRSRRGWTLRRWRRRATPPTTLLRDGSGRPVQRRSCMGWSTTVVAPPDGDMADYMASLDKLLAARRPRLLSRPRPGGDQSARITCGPDRPPPQREKQILRRSRQAGAAHPGHGRQAYTAASIRGCTARGRDRCSPI